MHPFLKRLLSKRRLARHSGVQPNDWPWHNPFCE